MNNEEILNVCNKVAEAMEMLEDEGFKLELISRKSKDRTERERKWKICFYCDDFEAIKIFSSASILEMEGNDLFHCLMSAYHDKFNEREDYD